MWVFFFFFLREHLKPAVEFTAHCHLFIVTAAWNSTCCPGWSWGGVSTRHLYLWLTQKLINQGEPNMPPQQPFSRAHPLAAFTKSIFMRILKNIALQILWKRQNSEKKNICTLAWGVFFFCLFPNQSQCAKHLTETDLPNQLISRDWSAVCAVCITITALLHCQTLEAQLSRLLYLRKGWHLNIVCLSNAAEHCHWSTCTLCLK